MLISSYLSFSLTEICFLVILLFQFLLQLTELTLAPSLATSALNSVHAPEAHSTVDSGIW